MRQSNAMAVGRMMILPNEPRGFESAGLLLYLSEQSGDPMQWLR